MTPNFVFIDLSFNLGASITLCTPTWGSAIRYTLRQVNLDLTTVCFSQQARKHTLIGFLALAKNKLTGKETEKSSKQQHVCYQIEAALVIMDLLRLHAGLFIFYTAVASSSYVHGEFVHAQNVHNRWSSNIVFQACCLACSNANFSEDRDNVYVFWLEVGLNSLSTKLIWTKKVLKDTSHIDLALDSGYVFTERDTFQPCVEGNVEVADDTPGHFTTGTKNRGRKYRSSVSVTLVNLANYSRKAGYCPLSVVASAHPHLRRFFSWWFPFFPMLSELNLQAWHIISQEALPSSEQMDDWARVISWDGAKTDWKKHGSDARVIISLVSLRQR